LALVNVPTFFGRYRQCFQGDARFQQARGLDRKTDSNQQ